MSDEGFHEIQLNGKQLVFLFMAATVVSVVIFLCGVMVGRGVRAQQATAAAATELGPAAAADEPPRSEPRHVRPIRPPRRRRRWRRAARRPPAPPPDPAERLELLRGAHRKPSPSRSPRSPRHRTASGRPPAPLPDVERPAEKPAPPPRHRGTRGGDRGLALSCRWPRCAIAPRPTPSCKRLAGKGYQAFVVNPVPGKPPVYKVQVGRFAERGDAEKTAARLKSQEQYSPWVTR